MMTPEQLQQRRVEMQSALNQMIEQRKTIEQQIGWHQGAIMMLDELMQSMSAQRTDEKTEPTPAAEA